MQFFLLTTGMNKKSTFEQLVQAVPVLQLEDNEKLLTAIKAAKEHLVPHLTNWYKHHATDDVDERATYTDAHRLEDVFEYLLKVAIRDGPIRQKFLEHPGSLYLNTFFECEEYMAWAECDEIKACFESMINPVPQLQVPPVMKEFCSSLLRKTEIQYQQMLDGLSEVKAILRARNIPKDVQEGIERAMDSLKSASAEATENTQEQEQQGPMESGSEVPMESGSEVPVPMNATRKTGTYSQRSVRFSGRASVGLSPQTSLPIIIPTGGKVYFKMEGDLDGAKYGFELVEEFYRAGLS